MKRIRQISVIGLVLFILFSCENKKEETKIEKEDINYTLFLQKAKTLDAVMINGLNFGYSLLYQEYFSDTNKYLLVDKSAYVSDIFKENGRYFIEGTIYLVRPSLYFYIECSKQQIDKLIKNKTGRGFRINFISTNNRVDKIKLAIGSEIIFPENAENAIDYELDTYSNITIETTDYLLLTGRLVVFYIEE